jgi:hypothetical protein
MLSMTSQALIPKSFVVSTPIKATVLSSRKNATAPRLLSFMKV